jgi:hypothetical protein
MPATDSSLAVERAIALIRVLIIKMVPVDNAATRVAAMPE